MRIMTGHAGEIRNAVMLALDPLQILLTMSVRILLIRPERTCCTIRLRVQILHHGLRLIELVHDWVVELIEGRFHACPNVATPAVLRVLVDDRLHFFRVLGMVSGGTVTGLAPDIKFYEGTFFIVYTRSVAVSALIEPIKPRKSAIPSTVRFALTFLKSPFAIGRIIQA